MQSVDQSLKIRFDFNSTLVRVSIADVTPEDAVRGPFSGTEQTVRDLVGQMVGTRHMLLRKLGAEVPNPVDGIYDGVSLPSDTTSLPALTTLHDAWMHVSDALGEALVHADEAVLGKPIDESIPMGNDVLAALRFFGWQESYRVGQLGLLRLELGYSSIQQRYYDSRAVDAA